MFSTLASPALAVGACAPADPLHLRPRKRNPILDEPQPEFKRHANIYIGAFDVMLSCFSYAFYMFVQSYDTIAIILYRLNDGRSAPAEAPRSKSCWSLSAHPAHASAALKG